MLQLALARLVQNHPPLAVQEGHAVTEGDDSLELLRDLQERGLDLFLLLPGFRRAGAVKGVDNLEQALALAQVVEEIALDFHQPGLVVVDVTGHPLQLVLGIFAVLPLVSRAGGQEDDLHVILHQGDVVPAVLMVNVEQLLHLAQRLPGVGLRTEQHRRPLYPPGLLGLFEFVEQSHGVSSLQKTVFVLVVGIAYSLQPADKLLPAGVQAAAQGVQAVVLVPELGVHIAE